MGDLYLIQNDKTKATQEYALTQTGYSASKKSGVNTDLEEALFLADHDLDLSQAVIKAENAFKERPSVYAADYLSWTLYKNGQFKEASKYTKDALRLGENDALILYHQGMISFGNNDVEVGKKYLTKALQINPNFSILESEKAKNKLMQIK